MRKIWIGVACALPLVAVQGAPRQVDVSAFDVAGVKLGMSVEEAKAALAAQFGVEQTALVDEKWPSADGVTGEKVPKSFVLKNGVHTVTVHHATDVLHGREPARAVYLVLYEMPYSEANVAAMRDAALQKYGENSNAPNDLPMDWCAEPHENTGLGCNDPRMAILQLSQTRLKLYDPRYQEAINAWREQKNNDIPKL